MTKSVSRRGAAVPTGTCSPRNTPNRSLCGSVSRGGATDSVLRRQWCGVVVLVSSGCVVSILKSFL